MVVAKGVGDVAYRAVDGRRTQRKPLLFKARKAVNFRHAITTAATAPAAVAVGRQDSLA